MTNKPGKSASQADSTNMRRPGAPPTKRSIHDRSEGQVWRAVAGAGGGFTASESGSRRGEALLEDCAHDSSNRVAGNACRVTILSEEVKSETRSKPRPLLPKPTSDGQQPGLRV